MTPDPASCAVTRPDPDDAVHHLGHGVAVHRPQGDPHSVIDVAVSVHSTDETHRHGNQKYGDETITRQHLVSKTW